MDIKALDKALQEIVEKRNELSKIDYNNPKYDDLEEQLHDLEDDFHDEYGDYLEEVLKKVHDEICPDTDVLFPIAYIAKSYKLNSKNEFSVAGTEGVFVKRRSARVFRAAAQDSRYSRTTAQRRRGGARQATVTLHIYRPY